MRQTPHDVVARHALASAAATPSVVHRDAVGRHRPIGLDPLPDDDEAEAVEARERGQVGASEGNVEHVEVLQMGSV